MGGSVGIICLLPTSRHMTSTDRNDLMPAQEQEKLEWVTPKISMMEAGETDGGGKTYIGAETMIVQPTATQIFSQGPS
jgi:hypothetical protein